MPNLSPDIHLYLFYGGCLIVIYLLIFIIKRRRRATRRKQIFKMVFGTSPPPQEHSVASDDLLRHLPRVGSRPEPIPAERRQKWGEARQLAHAGWNADQIAKHLSIGHDEIQIALHVDRPPEDQENMSSHTLAGRPSRVRRLAEEGVPPAEIGKRLGMSLQEVALILRAK